MAELPEEERKEIMGKDYRRYDPVEEAPSLLQRLWAALKGASKER